MSTLTIAVDLAKNVFEIAVAKETGTIIGRKRLTRFQFERFWSSQPHCRVIFEACASSHFWARYLEQRGFSVTMLPPAYVRPYRRRNKTDRSDCEAILEAHRCAGIHPVSIKSEDQQALMSLHRLRSQWLATRTSRINTIRALLHEFGIRTQGGPTRLLRSLHELLTLHEAQLPAHVYFALLSMGDEVQQIEARMKQIEQTLASIAANEPVVQQLMKIPGVGVLTATALYGSIPDIHCFKSGRQLASWLGLTPREFSSGSSRHMGRITKQGDPYLRTLLIHGARAALLAARRAQTADRPLTHLQAWALTRSSLMHQNKAAVALANKLSRIVWAVWYHNRSFNGDFAIAA